jgi:predicted methyltransferase
VGYCACKKTQKARCGNSFGLQMQIPMRWHPYRLRDLWHCDIPRKRFPKLFQKLKSGGLYIIEDLRWLPSMMEKEGITKTA